MPDDEEAKSVQTQIANAQVFAIEKGWTVDERHIYFDDSVNGADIRKLKARHRPGSGARGHRGGRSARS